MPGPLDAQGHPITAAGAGVAGLFDQAVAAYLGARADTRERLAAVQAEDPRCLLAHVLDAYLHLLTSTRASSSDARAAAERARAAAATLPPTEREGLHLAALGAWLDGDLREAARQWLRLLGHFPRDILAIRVSQFVLSYLGESTGMRDAMRSVIDAWDPDVPGYGFVLGCQAYALEEAGDYDAALELGRRAVVENVEDIWAAHAVTHVREMQGRGDEGLEWISDLAPHWRSCGNFGLHLRWHEGLFHLELGRPARGLELYDREIRPVQTDQYLDLANAASLLWRLEQAEIDVGDRWDELGRLAARHLDDHALVFADLHYLVALGGSGDADGADRLLRSAEGFARSGSTEATVMAEIGLPLGHAIVAHRARDYGRVVDLVLPIRSRIRRVGGSHAQRDLFEQLLIDAAAKGGRLEAAAELLAERVLARPRNRWGWTQYAAVLERQGSPRAARARRALARLR